MKKIKNFLKRIISKLTLTQSMIIMAVSGVLGIIFLLNAIEDSMTINCFYLFLFAIFFAIFIEFTCISMDKTVESVIERKTIKGLNLVKEILDGSYKLVKYEPKDVIGLDKDMFKLYSEVNKINLYARLDEENNICIVAKDDMKRDISVAIKTKSYMEFLENFYV